MKPASKGVRPEKEAVVGEIRTRVAGSKYIFLADYKGMNSGRTTELRRRLRKAGARFQVVPNRLLRQAVGTSGPDFGTSLLGPTAMVVGTGDVVEVAKTLAGFAREFTQPGLKGGALEGRFITADQIRSLATLPAKPVLQAILLGTLLAPATSLACVLNQKLASLVYVLQASKEQKEKAVAQG